MMYPHHHHSARETYLPSLSSAAADPRANDLRMGRYAITAAVVTLTVSLAVAGVRILYFVFYVPTSPYYFFYLGSGACNDAHRSHPAADVVILSCALSSLFLVLVNTDVWDWRPLYALLGATLLAAYLAIGFLRLLLEQRKRRVMMMMPTSSATTTTTTKKGGGGEKTTGGGIFLPLLLLRIPITLSSSFSATSAYHHEGERQEGGAFSSQDDAGSSRSLHRAVARVWTMLLADALGSFFTSSVFL